MENYKNELNNLSASERKEYNDLHTLRLLQARGAINTSNTDSVLEEILFKQESEGNVREETRGFWFWKRQVYTLTQLAQDYLSQEADRIMITTKELRHTSELDREKVMRGNGYSPAEYIVKKSILLDKVFDDVPIGFFNQTADLGTYLEGKYSNRVSKTKSAQSSTSYNEDSFFNDILFWSIILSDTGHHHQHNADYGSHSSYDHSSSDFGGSDHSSHDFGSHDSSSFDSGSFDSGGFDGSGCDGGGGCD
jgi:hypothetical protein